MEESGQLHAPDALPPRRAPGTHCIGRWIDPKAGLDAVEKRKILHCRESNAGRPARSPSLYRLSYPDSSVYVTGLTFRKNVSPPSSRYNMVQNVGYDVYCVENILEPALSSESDLDLYVIIRKLLYSILNITMITTSKFDIPEILLKRLDISSVTYPQTRLHCITSQTAIFVVAAMKTSNLISE
jgi:hypothetical protein